MPPVRKRVLENKKSELSPVVKDVKTAITATHHENIPIERVITHQDVTGKHCPHDIYDRYGIHNLYSEIKEKVEN